MRNPRPHTEKWREWKDNRLPGETYTDFYERWQKVPSREPPMEGETPPPLVKEGGDDG